MPQERVNFLFRCQPEKSSNYGVLLEYINSEKEKPKNELILTSLAALWLPLAYDSSTSISISDKELRKCALSAVYKLKLHIEFLEDIFGLDRQVYGLGINQNVNTNSVSNEYEQNESSGDLSEFTDFQDFQHEDDILNNIK